MDRTALTATLKPPERHGKVAVAADPVDPGDKRSRLVTPTPASRTLLAAALLLWERGRGSWATSCRAVDLDPLKNGREFSRVDLG